MKKYTKLAIIIPGILLLCTVVIAVYLADIRKEKEGEENAMGKTAFSYNRDPNYYTERFRPQYHLSPETGNMSDPNGMVYFEGEYHQFYQNSGQWGHAVSNDLIHWTHLPQALVRDSLGEIWSGSAVVDWKNTSGFFGGKHGLVAIFTHFKNGLQSQSIAYSSDKGRTWNKYEGNPVIPNPGLKDFRDPKVMWHEPSRSWVMIVSVDNRVRFYASRDLKHWDMTSEFGADQGSHAAVWECPDLFELPVEGSKNKKWVLTVSIGNNPTTKGSTAQYFVGSFDGKSFKNDNAPKEVLWTDYGKDNYAAVSYSDIPPKDGRRIFVGWMSNWRYPFTMPTEPWKGNMTIPRELKLRNVPDKGLRLVQHPVKELEALRGEPVTLAKQEITPGNNPLKEIRGTSYELDLEFTLQSAASLGVKVRTGGNQETIISYDTNSALLSVDRTNSGESNFEKGFAEKVSAPLKLKDQKIKLRLFVDESTLEVFANDGEVVLSNLIFPDPVSNGLELFATEGSVSLDEGHYYPMQTVWRDEDLNGKKPLRVILSGSSLDVPVGGTKEVLASVIPLASPQEVKWVSSDESVASVAQSNAYTANVTGKKAGKAEVKAITPDGAVSSELSVFVFDNQ